MQPNVNPTSFARTVTFSLNEEKEESFSFQLDSEISTGNLYELFTRKVGQKFYLDEQNRLQKATTICSRIKAWFQEDEIQSVVSSTLREFSTFLSRYQNEKVALAAVDHFFSREGSIGRLSKKIFNRKEFKKENDRLSEYLIKKNIIRLKIGSVGLYKIKLREDEKLEKGEFLKLDLGNEDVNRDLYQFLVSQKGEKLVQTAREIQKKSENIISHIETYLNGQSITHAHKVAIQKIFSEGAYHNLNAYLFREAVKDIKAEKKALKKDPSLIIQDPRKTPFSIISENSKIEQLLRPDYDQKRESFKKALLELKTKGNNPTTLRKFEEALMEFALTEFKFAQALGADLEKVGDGGSGGARYARDRYGHELFVVKPGDEGPYGKNNPHWFAKVKRWILSPKESLRDNPEPLAEVEACLIDRIFRLYIVPPTQLRYIASKQFNGEVMKECSVQMFVEGCQTLGNYVGISPKMYRFPRRFLTWYLGRTEEKIWIGKHREEAIQKLPAKEMQRVACHNVIISDTDCHPDNVLIKVRQQPNTKNVIEKLLDEEHVEDDEIEEFVSDFFVNKKHQAVLDAFLHSEVNEKGERVWAIKHDGGSSCGHSHPEDYDYLSLCYMYLAFDILPHSDAPFDLEELGPLFLGKDEEFVKGLTESAIQTLRNVLLHKIFAEFWRREENRTLLKKWMFEIDDSQEEKIRKELIETLWHTTLTCERNVTEKEAKYYFTKHLGRIRGNFFTRMQSRRILNKYITNKANMREFFKTVKTASDVKRELLSLADKEEYKKRMETWQTREVAKGDRVYKHSNDLSMTTLLADFDPLSS